MAKTQVSEWDETAANNTDVGGVSTAEGMAPSDVNDAIREMMAQIKTYTLAVFPAGSVIAYGATSPPTGWLLMNGETFGSAASSATNKSDDYETLFTLLWNQMADAQAAVVSGRGASAAADWAANKAITMVDARGRVIAGEEASATNLTSAVSGIDGSVLGVTGGDESAQDHTHSGSNTVVHTLGGATSGGSGATTPSALPYTTGNPDGSKHGGNAANVQPTIVLTWIMKT